MGKFFVILNVQDKALSPMVDDHNELALFDSHDDANHAADNNLLGGQFGYEIFETELLP